MQYIHIAAAAAAAVIVVVVVPTFTYNRYLQYATEFALTLLNSNPKQAFEIPSRH